MTRDSDYNDLSIVRGVPPKVIWIHRGNCSTQTIATMIRGSNTVIQEFIQNDSVGVLALQ